MPHQLCKNPRRYAEKFGFHFRKQRMGGGWYPLPPPLAMVKRDGEVINCTWFWVTDTAAVTLSDRFPIPVTLPAMTWRGVGVPSDRIKTLRGGLSCHWNRYIKPEIYRLDGTVPLRNPANLIHIRRTHTSTVTFDASFFFLGGGAIS